MAIKADPDNVTYSTKPRGETEARLAEMILYISQKCADDPGFGKTKLNKLMRKIDRLAFVELGDSVTGAEYTRQDQGPCPKYLKPVLERLRLLGDVRVVHRRLWKFQQQRVVAKREPNLTAFSSDQIGLANRVIEAEWGKNAKQVSDETHGRAWKIANHAGVPIPYEAIFISDDPLSREDIERTREVAKQLGW